MKDPINTIDEANARKKEKADGLYREVLSIRFFHII